MKLKRVLLVIFSIGFAVVNITILYNINRNLSPDSSSADVIENVDPNSVCGDGVVQLRNSEGLSEQCDDGTNNGVACNPSHGSSCQYCTLNCTLHSLEGGTCGDGTKQLEEQCDIGANNGRKCNPSYGGSCNYCNLSCQTTTILGTKCGDGITQKDQGEQCDNGALNGVDCDSGDTTCLENKCSEICRFPED